MSWQVKHQNLWNMAGMGLLLNYQPEAFHSSSEGGCELDLSSDESETQSWRFWSWRVRTSAKFRVLHHKGTGVIYCSNALQETAN